MKKITNSIICLLLCAALLASLAGCGNAKLTEANITKAVQTTETALKEFDAKTLQAYVQSSTLSLILKYAGDKEQFVSLGKVMFENLTMEVKSVDAENGIVTLSVKNKELHDAADSFARDLNSQYNKFQLLMQLDSDLFLDGNLAILSRSIQEAPMQEESTEITLKVEQGKKNLVLVFDETAEDAVSGGALTAIKKVFADA